MGALVFEGCQPRALSCCGLLIEDLGEPLVAHQRDVLFQLLPQHVVSHRGQACSGFLIRYVERGAVNNLSQRFLDMARGLLGILTGE